MSVSSDVAQNKQTVREFFQHLSEGELDEAMALWDDGGTWWVAGDFPLSGTYPKAEMRELFEGVSSGTVDGLEIKPKVFTAEENRVAVIANSFAETTEGKSYRNEYHFLITFKGDKIDDLREYMDTMHANEVFCS